MNTPDVNVSGGQYSLYRALLGSYLCVHFGYLLLFAVELFSSAGMLASGALSPLFGIAPSLFHLSDAPAFVALCVGSGVIAGGLFAVGKYDRLAAAWMLLLLISLFSRNPLIANPALPYVGFMLLLHLFVPKAPYGSLAARGRPDPSAGWRLPPHLFLAATIVLAVSYSYSGYTKLLSPGWVSGETVGLVLQNPLARDWWLREAFLALPDIVLQCLTWFILVIELVFAPLYLVRRLRFGLWAGMLAVQVGFLLLLRFPDLTIPMLLFHLLTFDPRWLAPKSLPTSTLKYDGACGVCHGAVRFALAELPQEDLSFEPMQRDPQRDVARVASWELHTANGIVLERTDAAIALLKACGGSWRLLGQVLACVPRRLRDAAYALLARSRHRLAPAPQALCPIVAPHLRARFH